MSGTAFGDPVIKQVEWQVKQQGGILGGRELKVIKYDNRGSVPEAQAGAMKLYLNDKVSAIVWGGLSPTEMKSVSDYCEEHRILYVSNAEFPNLEETKFSVLAATKQLEYNEKVLELTNNLLKPKTVAFIGCDVTDVHARGTLFKSQFEALGVKMVYEEYVQPDTTDFIPYLTKVKYLNPDVLLMEYSGITESYVANAKQIMDLGGWGDIKVVANAPAVFALGRPGAEGWYIRVVWVPGGTYPASVKFEKDFQTVNSNAPSANHLYFYMPLWTAIHAIELAGTDTDLVAIAQAARSGKLEWDTPMGYAVFSQNGVPDLHSIIGHVEGGKLVPVTLPK